MSFNNQLAKNFAKLYQLALQKSNTAVNVNMYMY